MAIAGQPSLAVVCLALVLGGCAAEAPAIVPEVNDVEHAQYGVVQRADPRFMKDLDECARPSYAAGIDVDGLKLTDRAAVIAAYAAYLKATYTYEGEDTTQSAPVPVKASRTSARAGASGLVTSSTATAKTTTAAPAPQLGEPAFARAYFAAEKAMWDCVHAKGWSEIRR